ncbi:MAG: hypothetical protein WCL39_13415, partial [Armatimonadota bacterium]
QQTDTTPPVITSVDAAPTMVGAGEAVHVMVTASDNIGVQQVTANNVVLAKTGADLWQGDIVAVAEQKAHPIFVVATDAAGLSATNSSNSYQTARIVGAGLSAMSHPIMIAASYKFLFKAAGKVTATQTDWITIEDGSGKPLNVHAVGHQITVGQWIEAQGILKSTLTPPVLESSVARITVLN